MLQDLVNDETSISGDSAQLMKFHGSYQQDDRERRTKGQGKFYQFMMRTRQPAGHVTNRLYKVMDDLADLVRVKMMCRICALPFYWQSALGICLQCFVFSSQHARRLDIGSGTASAGTTAHADGMHRGCSMAMAPCG
jgi:hypothetical protein